MSGSRRSREIEVKDVGAAEASTETEMCCSWLVGDFYPLLSVENKVSERMWISWGTKSCGEVRRFEKDVTILPQLPRESPLKALDNIASNMLPPVCWANTGLEGPSSIVSRPPP